MTQAETAGAPTVPYSLGKAIEAVKEAVPIEDYLDSHGVKVRRNRAVCIVHGGDNPQSFSINPETQRWHCFRCSESGDIIDLYQAIEGGENWVAVQDLAQRFGVKLPERPPRWFEWQRKKGRVRDDAQRHIASVYVRRLTRLYAPLVLVGGETPAEEMQELERLSSALWPVALELAGRRVSDEG